MDFKKKFWEEKIIAWEDGRYALDKTNLNTLEHISDKLSSSLIFRQKVAIEMLTPLIKDSNIVELGCGSGLLSNIFIKLGCKSYTGYDISEKAIDRAKKNQLPTHIKFYSAGVSEIKNIDADIVFSLGLFDWLTDMEIEKIFFEFRSAKHLHSISENKKLDFYIFLHKIYVYLSYGFKTNGYKPKYHTLNDIKKLYAKEENKISIYRHKKLKFGAFIKDFN
jgi:SAM-dependent methyltransferase